MTPQQFLLIIGVPVIQFEVSLALAPSVFTFFQSTNGNCLETCYQTSQTSGPVCCSGTQYSDSCSAKCKLPINKFLQCLQQPCQDSNSDSNSVQVFDTTKKKLTNTSIFTSKNYPKSDQKKGTKFEDEKEYEDCNCPEDFAPFCCEKNQQFLNSCFAECKFGKNSKKCIQGECEKQCVCEKGENIGAESPVCCLLLETFKNRCLARCELGSNLADSQYICFDGSCEGSKLLDFTFMIAPTPIPSPAPVPIIRPVQEMQCDNFPVFDCIPCAKTTTLPNYFYNPKVKECQPTNCCNFGAFITKKACTQVCG